MTKLNNMYANHTCTIRFGSDSYLPPLSESAPFVERFCRAFRKTTLVSSQHPSGKIYFRSHAAIAHERKRHMKANLLYIIHPFSLFRTYWELWMLVMFLAALVYNPIDVAFRLKVMTGDAFSTTISTILDIFCILDIIITFFTGYGKHSTKEVVLEPKKIALRYIRTYFLADVISSVPYRLLYFVFKFEAKTVVILNATALLRIHRLRTLMIYFKGAADMWQISILWFLFIKYSMFVILVIHWTACLHYCIPISVAVINGRMYNNSWIITSRIDNYPSNGEKYIHCVYRACSYLLTVSYGIIYPSTVEDIIVGIVTYLVGTTLSTLLFVLLLQMFCSVQSAQTKYYEIMNQVQQYMRYKQLPLNMQQRLIIFYEYKFQKKYFREDVITQTLSERLRREVNVYCYRRLVDSVSIFQNVPYYVLVEIVNSLKCEIYLPNDIIVKAGTVGDCMYFLATGTVCVLTPTGKEVCHLYDGAYFGEIALIMKDQKRIANVIAIEICEVYRLSKKHFKTCFHNNENLFKQIEKLAEDRYEKTKILEDLHKKYLMALQIPLDY